jgi:tRNA modification GTPase
MHDTIVAIATPPGKSAIAVIRLSGIDSLKIVKRVISDKAFEIEPWTIRQCNIKNPNNSILVDEVIIAYMKAPKSYTGEDLVEIYCHGGKVIIQSIYDLLIESGAKPARNGEFTKRAFLNGKIDLIKAEAVDQIINAETYNELYLSNANLFGYFSDKVNELISNLISLKTNIEYIISFQDESVEEKIDINSKIQDILNKVNEILIKTRNTKLKTNKQVCIIGKSNVGKSSLFNALLGWERMVVSPYPSTTHDYVEEIIELNGYELKLTDTAGSMKNPEIIDELFIERIDDLVKDSFLLLLVIDLSDYSEIDEIILKKYINKNLIIIFNKSDISINVPKSLLRLIPKDKEYCLISTFNKTDIDLTRNRIFEIVKKHNDDLGEFYINERQIGILDNIKIVLLGILNINNPENFLDLISKEIGEILKLLDEETGQQVNEQVIENIFKNFCIGK